MAEDSGFLAAQGLDCLWDLCLCPAIEVPGGLQEQADLYLPVLFRLLLDLKKQAVVQYLQELSQTNWCRVCLLLFLSQLQAQDP